MYGSGYLTEKRVGVKECKAWVVAADMGYGHQRAAWPLADIAEEKIISIGTDEYTSPSIRKKWSRIQRIYEFISRNKELPFIGKYLFNAMDYLLEIPSYYPVRDLSRPTFQVTMLEKYIRDGLYDGMIEKIRTKNLPLVTSFYAPAIAADYAGYDRIYCIITDTDANRVWVTKDPGKSRIRYFVPSTIAYGRLLQYGVPEKNLYLTGFPLSDILIGGRNQTALKQSLTRRLNLLDPTGIFRKNFGDSVTRMLGFDYTAVAKDKPLTITYAVGGAGAQKEIAAKIMRGLNEWLNDGRVQLNLVAGTRKEVSRYFEKLVAASGHANIRIVYAESKDEYFRIFDETITQTDILWTKPSELTFYAGLGLPVICSPSIGAQENANKRWLRDDIGAGIMHRKPKYCSQWIGDYLSSGRLAEAAWLGFLKVEKMGRYNIIDKLIEESE